MALLATRLHSQEAAAALEAAAGEAVAVDGSFVRLGLAYLRAPSPALLAELAGTPAARTIAEHARRVALPAGAPSAEELVASLLLEVEAAGHDPDVLEAMLYRLESDGPALRRCRAEAARYLPAGALDGAVLHLTLGYDIGVALAGAATLNLAHPRFHGDFRELWFYCVHELHHAGFMTYHDLPELASIRTTTDLAALVRALTFLEGLAVHAARGWRAAAGALEDDPDYAALQDAVRMRGYEQEYFRLYHLLERAPHRPLVPGDWDVLEPLAGGDRLWYRVGALMAERIEEELGREALIEAVVAGPHRFFELYALLPGSAGALYDGGADRRP